MALILLFRANPTPERAVALRDLLPGAAAEEVSLIRDAIALHPAQSGREALHHALLDEAVDRGTRLRVACVLSALEPIPEGTWEKLSVPLTQALLAEDRRSEPHWIDLLGPASVRLIPELGRICGDATTESSTRSNAAEALTEALARQPDFLLLAQLVVESQPDASHILLDHLTKIKDRAEVGRFLRGVLSEVRTGPARDGIAKRQAAACIALATLGEADAIWPHLRESDDPCLRSFLIEALSHADSLQPALIERLQSAGVDPIELQAILLVWAETKLAAISVAFRARVIELARKLYLEEPHSGIHSAAELILRRFNEAETLASLEKQLRESRRGAEGKDWLLGPNGHTFAILRGPLRFRMGSPIDEEGREAGREGRDTREPVHERRIDRTIAVSTTEVTLDQWNVSQSEKRKTDRYAPSPQCAVTNVTWYEAAGYCNWLSSQDPALTPDDWCYDKSPKSGMSLFPNALKHRGYRLPTEAEFEYFCRAKTITSRPFGESEELLPKYAWTWLNSRDRLHPVGMLMPNTFGLFDVLGNAYELCHNGQRVKDGDAYTPYPVGTTERPAGDDDVDQRATIDDSAWRLVRGGAFPYAPASARSASRYTVYVTLHDSYLGFRVVQTLADKPR